MTKTENKTFNLSTYFMLPLLKLNPKQFGEGNLENVYITTQMHVVVKIKDKTLAHDYTSDGQSTFELDAMQPCEYQAIDEPRQQGTKDQHEDRDDDLGQIVGQVMQHLGDFGQAQRISPSDDEQQDDQPIDDHADHATQGEIEFTVLHECLQPRPVREFIEMCQLKDALHTDAGGFGADPAKEQDDDDS